LCVFYSFEKTNLSISVCQVTFQMGFNVCLQREQCSEIQSGKAFWCDNYLSHWWLEFEFHLTWLDCLLITSEGFIFFAEITQILLKIYFIPIILTFMYVWSSTFSENWVVQNLKSTLQTHSLSWLQGSPCEVILPCNDPVKITGY
jgi:hypothetical protein